MIRRLTKSLIILLLIINGFAQNMDNDSTLIKLDKIIKKDSLNWRFVTQSPILPMPVIAKTKKDNDGNIVGLRGLSIIPLGYYIKNYYKPLKVDTWNTYWHSGMVILPYIGVGTEYIRKDGFYFGIGTIFPLPLIYLGKYF